MNIKCICFMAAAVALFGLCSCTSDTTSSYETKDSISVTENSVENVTLGDEYMTDEQKILAVYRKFQDAMIEKDTEYLRSVMGDTVTHITGRVQTIDEWLDDVEKENMKYYSIEILDPVIEIDGDSAVLNCSNKIDARIYGSRGMWTLSGSAYFERNGDDWIMKAEP